MENSFAEDTVVDYLLRRINLEDPLSLAIVVLAFGAYLYFKKKKKCDEDK